MRDSLKLQLHLFLLHRIPLLTTLFFMFVFFMPVYSLQINYLRPIIAIICVYYWTLRRGYLFGFISAFIVGFVTDIYSSSPLGINIFMLMLLSGVTQWLSHYFQSASFGAGWFIFSIVCMGFMLIKWAILSIYTMHIIAVGEIGFGYLATVMFYPLIAWLNVKVQTTFLPQEHINE